MARWFSLRGIAVFLVGASLFFVGCSSRRTTILLRIEAYQDEGPFDELKLRVFSSRGEVVFGKRLPEEGKVSLPNDVVLYPRAATGTLRLLVNGFTTGAFVAQGAVKVVLRPGEQVLATLLLHHGKLPDGDGDGVPDIIDNCPKVSNADQGPCVHLDGGSEDGDGSDLAVPDGPAPDVSRPDLSPDGGGADVSHPDLSKKDIISFSDSMPVMDVASPPDGPSSSCPCQTCQKGGIVFVTSETYTGSMGGLSGADAACARLAGAAGLTGRFVAWLSDRGTNARDRIAGGPWWRRDGKLVACDLTELLSSGAQIPIQVTEQGKVTSEKLVWTGTDGDGRVDSSSGHDLCSDWTSAIASPEARLGRCDLPGKSFTASQTGYCKNKHAIYCFQVR